LVSGTVTEIIDGRTVLITSDTGKKTNLILRYIEVPEPEQPLSQTVKEHLGKLVLNKQVTYSPELTYPRGFIGRLFLSEIDISQQMLRDGAAWFDLPNNPNADETSEYRKMENLAKSEKRGVWGIAGLKTAWEFRDEQFQKKVEARKKIIKPAKEIKMWAEISDTESKSYKSGYDKFTDTTVNYTYPMTLISEPDKSFELKLVVGHAFLGKDVKNSEGDVYILQFTSKAVISFLSSSSELIFLAGNNRWFLKNPSHTTVFTGEYFLEMPVKADTLRFEMESDDFKNFIKEKRVEFRIGNYEGVITSNQLATIKNLP
jgi:endonuclease YncB( thermonuclease family)